MSLINDYHKIPYDIELQEYLFFCISPQTLYANNPRPYHILVSFPLDIFPGNSATITCTSTTPSSWTFTPHGSSTPGSWPANVVQDGQTATIIGAGAYHEGSYSCLDSDQNVISSTDIVILGNCNLNKRVQSYYSFCIIGLAKYKGCSSQSSCDNSLTLTIAEGQSLPVNISFEFFNGGSQGEKQTIIFVFVRNPGNLVSCRPLMMTCNDLEKNGLISFPVKGEYDINAILANRTVADSGVYTVHAELYTTNSLVYSITSYFTVAVTATSKLIASIMSA